MSALAPAIACNGQEVFNELAQKNRQLALNRMRLRLACRTLASANGSGDGIRRRVREMLAKLVEVDRVSSEQD